MINADLAERIHHRIHDGGRGTDGPRLAYAFDPERIGRARDVAEMGCKVAHVVGARHPIVHVGSREKLTARAVVHHVLYQGLADPLSDSALYLAFADHRIDRTAAVVHHAMAIDGDAAGRGVKLDLADVTTVRIARDMPVGAGAGLEAERAALAQERRIEGLRRVHAGDCAL